jgi:hypothetical protein
MKVVINSCFGGFSLSPLATKRLAELNGRECYFFVMGRKPDGGLDPHALVPVSVEEAKKAFVWYAYDIPNPNEVLPRTDNWGDMTFEERKAANDAADSHSVDHGRCLERHDPKLIQVVEELGDKANGAHARLSIVTIPDGTDYEIDEYDGNEHIAEKHQTWYADSTN